MTNFVIVVRNRKSKSFDHAIPTRKGVSKSVLMREARRQISKKFRFKIITEAEFKKMVLGKSRRKTNIKKRKKIRRR